MSQGPSTMVVDPSNGRFKKILKLYFTYIMLVFVAIGLVMIAVGVLSGIPVIAAIGSSLFSASTISTIFKVMGFDIYISGNLSEKMEKQTHTIAVVIQKGELESEERLVDQIQKTIAGTMSSTKFLDKLSRPECKSIIQSCIQRMKRGMPSTDVYQAFEDVYERLVGLVAENRHYSVSLEPARAYGQHVLKVAVQYSAKMFNQSPDDIQLFENGLVTKTDTTVPRNVDVSTLSKPEDLTRFAELRIDDKAVEPDAIKHYWHDPSDKKSGAGFIANCSRIIRANSQPVNVACDTESLIDDVDFIIRRFLTFTVGVTLVVNHPPDVEIDVIWFQPEKVVVHKPVRKKGAFEQAADGVFLPGMGFLLTVKKRK